jgi:hypothetical protein
MDLMLVKKVLKAKSDRFADAPAGNPAMNLVWSILSIIAMGIAIFHAYHANKCDEQWRLIVAIVLSFLFPKLAAIYYLVKYGLPKFDEASMKKLHEKYLNAIPPARLRNECRLVTPSAPPYEGPAASPPSVTGSPMQQEFLRKGGSDIDMMFGGW